MKSGRSARHRRRRDAAALRVDLRGAQSRDGGGCLRAHARGHSRGLGAALGEGKDERERGRRSGADTIDGMAEETLGLSARCGKRDRRCRKTEARDAPSRRTRSRSWRSSSFSPRYSRAFDRGGVRGSLSCLARQLRAARTDEAGMLIHPSAKSASIRPTASQQAGSKVPFFTQRSVSTFDRPPLSTNR